MSYDWLTDCNIQARQSNTSSSPALSFVANRRQSICRAANSSDSMHFLRPKKTLGKQSKEAILRSLRSPISLREAVKATVEAAAAVPVREMGARVSRSIGKRQRLLAGCKYV